VNNKKVPRTLTSAIFLAIVLVAGTFAAMSPSSFITGVNAQAESYNYDMNDRYSDYEQDYGMDNYDKKSYNDNYESDYGKDRDYDKSKKDTSNSVSIKKLKCNNINANLNNVDANFGSPIPSDGTEGGANGEALSAQGAEAISANGLMNGANNGDRSFVDRENNFAFVCINNNNNTVVEAPAVEDECPEAEDIEGCFEEFLNPDQFELLTDTLASSAGLTVEINGQEVTLRSFEDICEALEGITTFEQLEDAVLDILEGLPGPSFPSRADLIDCISEAFDIPISLR
jgi:hypothetical protein